MKCYLSQLQNCSMIGVDEDEIKFKYFESKLGCLEVITNEIDVYVI